MTLILLAFVSIFVVIVLYAVAVDSAYLVGVVRVLIPAVVLSQLLHVLSHWPIAMGHKPSSKMVRHWSDDNLFLLFVHGCVVVLAIVVATRAVVARLMVPQPLHVLSH